MTLKQIAIFITAAAVCISGAVFCANWVETRSAQVVKSAMIDENFEFVEVSADGLLVTLMGEAPDEATRFRVVSKIGQIIDSDRIVDHMDVKASARIKPPRFIVEILRNSEGISLIGLIPTKSKDINIAENLRDLTEDDSVTDLLETADYPAPDGWENAINFSIKALRDLPHSKISVTSSEIYITAISDSLKDKRRIEKSLNRTAPNGIRLVTDISAPRPVITPFTLRFTLNKEGGEFDACSAESEKSKKRILMAAKKAGLKGISDCTIGLGVPSPNWAKAVEVAIAGLKELGGGALTFSDADISIVALDSTSQKTFDHVIGDIEANLPAVFSLHAVLPPKVELDGTGKPAAIEFTASRTPEGDVKLRGRLPNNEIKKIVTSFARAQFGSEKVYVATRNDKELPETWPVRVLAALEGLGMLEHGDAVVQKDYLEIRGLSGSKSASGEVSRMLADKLGDAENFEVSVRYDKILDPTLDIPTPQECVKRINAVLKAAKITFEPSSADITESAEQTIDQIAEIAKLCDRVKMEIGGHTDSQGREIMNKTLSQRRADSVLAALMSRRIRTRNMTAKGYGESVPIADNKTEAGREANRRIEFRLLEAEPLPIDGSQDKPQKDLTATDATQHGKPMSSKSQNTKRPSPKQKTDSAPKDKETERESN